MSSNKNTDKINIQSTETEIVYSPYWLFSKVLYLIPLMIMIVVLVPPSCLAQVMENVKDIPGVAVTPGTMKVHVERQVNALKQQKKENYDFFLTELVSMVSKKIDMSETIEKAFKKLGKNPTLPVFNFVQPVPSCTRIYITQTRAKEIVVEKLITSSSPNFFQKVLELSGGFIICQVSTCIFTQAKNKTAEIWKNIKNKEKGESAQENSFCFSSISSFITQPASFVVMLIVCLFNTRKNEFTIPFEKKQKSQSYFNSAIALIKAHPILASFFIFGLAILVYLFRSEEKRKIVSTFIVDNFQKTCSTLAGFSNTVTSYVNKQWVGRQAHPLEEILLTDKPVDVSKLTSKIKELTACLDENQQCHGETIDVQIEVLSVIGKIRSNDASRHPELLTTDIQNQNPMADLFENYKFLSQTLDSKSKPPLTFSDEEFSINKEKIVAELNRRSWQQEKELQANYQKNAYEE